MEAKNLVVPVLCILGTLWAVRGCENAKRCPPCCNIPQRPVSTYHPPIQSQPTYYREVYPQSETIIIRRRHTRRIIQTTTMPVYEYEY